MQTTRSACFFLLFVLCPCFMPGMDNPVPSATGPQLPARPITPIIDLLSAFNFALLDEQTLKPCTKNKSAQEAILEDSLALRRFDS